MKSSARYFSLLIAAAVLANAPLRAEAYVGRCELHFMKVAAEKKKALETQASAPKAPMVFPSRDPKAAWTMAVDGVKSLFAKVTGTESAFHALITASLAKEFAWFNGDPGGAKTMRARLVFAGQLATLPDETKRTFVLQFHKLLSEGVITGHAKFKELYESGKYVVETKSALVSDEFFFAIFDEVEKASPSTLMALLSVLNERKAFLGDRVVDTMLTSGVFTTNKSVADLLRSCGDDRPACEALLDRIGIKVHVPNQPKDSDGRSDVYEAAKKGKSDSKPIPLPLQDLAPLVEKVEVSPELMKDVSKLIFALDGIFTRKADESSKNKRATTRKGVFEYFPATVFSNRTDRRLIKIMKASFIAQQIEDGVPFEKLRLKMERADLAHLATGALLGGPSRIRLKQIALPKMDFVSEYFDYPHYGVENIRWNPYTQQMFVHDEGRVQIFQIDLAQGTAARATDFGERFNWRIEPEQMGQVIAEIKASEQAAGIDRNKPEFEVDETIDMYLSDARPVPRETKDELRSIKEDMIAFVGQLNALMETPQERSRFDAVKIREQLAKAADKAKQMAKAVASALANPIYSADQRSKINYRVSQNAFKELVASYPELEHSIRAHFVALMAESHLYVFGPPGGAKTSLAKTIIDAELRSMDPHHLAEFNSKFAAHLKKMNPRAYDVFMLQMHKMISEARINGSPKFDKQFNDGVVEFETSTSLVNQKFIFAIVDEVEKGNSAVLTSFLSILNEREAFHGNVVLKAALKTAVLTSNKVPSEFLDSFGEQERMVGKAFLDRAINKVYVSNKFSDVDVLAKFLTDLEHGLNPSLKAPLALSQLKGLVHQVEDPPRYLVKTVGRIFDRFVAKRLVEEEKTREAFHEDGISEPDYYVRASSESDRTFVALLEQWKASLIVDQIARGVPFERIRFKLEVSDLPLFFNGLGYWSPLKINTTYANDGIIHFEVDEGVAGKLSQADYVNERNKFLLRHMIQEATTYVDIANEQVRKSLVEYHGTIADNLEIFPMAFKSSRAREEWLDKQGQR